MPMGVFSHSKKVWQNTRISLRTKIGIFESSVMTVVKFGDEMWKLRKAEEDLLHVSQSNSLRTVLGICLTDLISNSKLYKKCDERKIGMGRTHFAD